MDVHPDAVIPPLMRGASTASRVDEGSRTMPSQGDEAATVLRARLLQMIVANEKARHASASESSRPR